MRSVSKPVLIFGGVVVAAVAAVLAFGVFGVHTLFVDNEVDEANPFAESTSAPSTSGAPADASVVEAPSETEPAAETTPEIRTVSSGDFVSSGNYTTVGNGATITDGAATFLRFEGFETSNGPDLKVYLRSADDPDDYLDLGPLSGNIGDQNYELPADVDLDRYNLVDIWCERFGTSFGSAQLA